MKYLLKLILMIFCSEVFGSTAIQEIEEKKHDAHRRGVVVKRLAQHKKTKGSSAQRIINSARIESPFGETPSSNIIADCGRAQHLEDMNAVLADPKHPKYSEYFRVFERWVNDRK